MDIKSKNIKYAIGLKIFASVLAWIFFVSTAISGLFLIYHVDEVFSRSYFETYEFQERFGHLMHNATEWHIKLIDRETIENSDQTDKAKENDLSRLKRIESNLGAHTNFIYWIENSITGDVFTNIPVYKGLKYLKSQQNVVFADGNTSSIDRTIDIDNVVYSYSINDFLYNTDFTIHAAVLNPLQQGDSFYNEFIAFSDTKDMCQFAMIVLAISLILFLTSFTYLLVVVGRRYKGDEIQLNFIDKIYTDIHTLMVFIAAMFSLIIMSNFYIHDEIGLYIQFGIILSLDFWIGLSYALSMVKQIKNKQLFKNSLIFKVFSLLKMCFRGKLFRPTILLLLLAYAGINCIIVLITLFGGRSFLFFGALLFIAFNTVSLFFSAKALLSLTKIMEATKALSKGNLNYQLDPTTISFAFLDQAGDLQSLQEGLKKAVDEAVKGERMKTDLITNVSHDLKTPLTSIITYVDLLKQEKLENESAVSYIDILEGKSSRLKQLIDDLMDASKASSGNLACEEQKVDLYELMLQAIGEYEEKLQNANLDLRIQVDQPPIWIKADGKHMWRIVENLFTNIVKYAMPNSRIYVDLETTQSYGSLTLKNISAAPLDIKPEQLTERFVRGDVSRTTEGSGLGLSITDSLTTLQGGKFKINIDGDLFKVNIQMPLWIEDLD